MTVNARHMDATESLRSYIHEKLDKLPRYFDGIGTAEVVLDREADDLLVEIIVTARPKHTLVATHRDKDMYACLDKCLDKITRQLRKYKDKMRDRHPN